MKRSRLERRRNERYIRVQESLQRLCPQLAKRMPSDSYAPRWVVLEEGIIVRMGPVPMIPPGETRYRRALHPAEQGMEDVAAFERSIVEGRGEKALIKFALENPVVIHRMGYFDVWGIRDLTSLSLDGTATVFDPASMEKKESYKPEVDIRKPVLTNFISAVLDRILREGPGVYLYVHVLGKEISIGLVTEFIRKPKGYVDGNELRIIDGCTPMQRRNMEAIVRRAEKENVLIRSGHPQIRYTVLFDYYRETIDTAQYWLFGNGSLIAMSNLRAMPGMISSAIERGNTLDELFLHRAGSHFDPELLERAMSMDIREGMVLRSQNRVDTFDQLLRDAVDQVFRSALRSYLDRHRN